MTEELAPESTNVCSVADRLGASRLLISTGTWTKPVERALLARQSARDTTMSPYLDQDVRLLNLQLAQ